MTKSIHLKESKAYLDRIATAKTQHHWINASKHNVITETPGSKTGKSNPDAPGWARMKPTTADNTYTAKGGSKRD